MIRLRALSHRDRRALAFGATTLLLTALGRVWLPILGRWERACVVAADESKRRASTLRRLTERNARMGETQRTSATSDSTVLIARDPGSAAARLVAVTRELTSIEGMVLHAVQPRIDSTRSGAAFLGSARATITTDVQGLAELLTSIEGGTLLLRVSEISVLQSDVFDSDDRSDVLKVDLTVQGVVIIQRGVE